MLQRFLDPATLASISSLDLVAKTVVDGFVAGLHRSPDFGFCQEFAEYRAYTEGDDLRHVDWNVFARTDKCFPQALSGETNTQLLVLLDTRASMGYSSHEVNKLDYARFVAASLVLPGQHAARRRRPDRLRRGREELRAALHPPGTALPPAARHRESRSRARTPISPSPSSISRISCIAAASWWCMSDFYEDPETIIKTVEPLRYQRQ